VAQRRTRRAGFADTIPQREVRCWIATAQLSETDFLSEYFGRRARPIGKTAVNRRSPRQNCAFVPERIRARARVWT